MAISKVGNSSRSPWSSLAKWVLGLMLMWLLIAKGYLNLDSVGIFLKDIRAVCLTIILEMTVLALSLTRWHLILRAIGLRITFSETVRIGMIGQFFSIAIPGTVSGDVVKCAYIAKLTPGKMPAVISSVFLDRLLGLAAMIILVVTSLLLWWLLDRNGPHELTFNLPFGSHGMKYAQFAIALILGIVLILLLAPSSFTSRVRLFFRDTYRTIRLFSRDPMTLVYTGLLSLSMHVLNVLMLLIIACSVYGPTPWGNITPVLFVTASVIGLALMAIPITPAGLGVGQAAFSGIFLLLGAPDPTFGAIVITGYHIAFITVGALGFIFLIVHPFKPGPPGT